MSTRVNKHGEKIGYITGDGKTSTLYDRSGKREGYISWNGPLNGAVYDRSGKNIGIIKDGSYYDRYEGYIGSITSEGVIKDKYGNYSGKIYDFEEYQEKEEQREESKPAPKSEGTSKKKEFTPPSGTLSMMVLFLAVLLIYMIVTSAMAAERHRLDAKNASMSEYIGYWYDPVSDTEFELNHIEDAAGGYGYILENGERIDINGDGEVDFYDRFHWEDDLFGSYLIENGPDGTMYLKIIRGEVKAINRHGIRSLERR